MESYQGVNSEGPFLRPVARESMREERRREKEAVDDK
jgi:hypothetical protein